MSGLTGTDNINMFRIKTLRSALKLECLGMTKRGRSAYKIIKQEFGFVGNKQEVLRQLEMWIKMKEVHHA